MLCDMSATVAWTLGSDDMYIIVTRYLSRQFPFSSLLTPFFCLAFCVCHRALLLLSLFSPRVPDVSASEWAENTSCPSVESWSFPPLLSLSSRTHPRVRSALHQRQLIQNHFTLTGGVDNIRLRQARKTPTTQGKWSRWSRLTAGHDEYIVRHLILWT